MRYLSRCHINSARRYREAATPRQLPCLFAWKQVSLLLCLNSLLFVVTVFPQDSFRVCVLISYFFFPFFLSLFLPSLHQCHSNYIPVCGSNGDTYQNECFLRQAACKQQKSISVASEGPCYPGESEDTPKKVLNTCAPPCMQIAQFDYTTSCDDRWMTETCLTWFSLSLSLSLPSACLSTDSSSGSGDGGEEEIPFSFRLFFQQSIYVHRAGAREPTATAPSAWAPHAHEFVTRAKLSGGEAASI